jgi:acetyl-CoA acetyltransferase
MSNWLDQNGGVYVVGVGMHRYQFPSSTPFTKLGLTAVREALDDSKLPWNAVQSAFVGTTSIGMAVGRVMLRHLGSTGLEVTQIENASASGSFAFRQACLAIAAGACEVVLAMGVDKHGDGQRAVNKDGMERLSDTATIPATHFALTARNYLRKNGLNVEAIARVAVKNHGNAAKNPYAQFRKSRTLEEVLTSPVVIGDLTTQQCCPRGEGAAATLLVSGNAIDRLRLDCRRAIRVRASIANSEMLEINGEDTLSRMVRDSAQAAYGQAGVSPSDLDLVELHDAFSVEELLYTEAMGLCQEGEGSFYLNAGHSAIGGRCAVNASGGLIGMGHPLGPTGIGQIVEITRQIRGEATDRQHPGARMGMAHMIGLGNVGIAHILGN